MKYPWRSLSVFLPVYNEAEALPAVLENGLKVLQSMRLANYELIVVDDGSSDATGEIAEAAARRDEHVRVVHHAKNMGYGAALTSGFLAARYEWLAYIDGDGQFDLTDLARFAPAARRVDIVLGCRRKRHDHAGRKLNAALWSGLVWLMLGLKVRDLDCGFKLFKAERVKRLGQLEARGAVISAELLVRLRRQGCAWEEVPVEHYDRRGGAASGAKFSVIWRAIRELYRLRRRLKDGEA